MATPPSDDTRMLFKLLADGEWHLYTDIRDAIAEKVPPGRALRKYQERVEYARRYKQDPGYDTSASEDERILLGARACAQVAITSWKGRGIHYNGKGENKQIRVRPGFTSWGLGIEGLPDPGSEDSVASEPLHETPDGPVIEIPTVEIVELTPEQDAEAAAAYGPPDAIDIAAAPAESVAQSELAPVVTASDIEAVMRAVEARKSPDLALVDESELRHIISEEIAKQLDGFQVGMQTFLNDQFDQLRQQISAQKMPAGKWWFDPYAG